MILVDNNQIIIGSLFAQTKNGQEVSHDLIRHMVLNTYRIMKNKFSREYGELVICHDSGDCWRKKFFPEYKASRKKQKKKSVIIAGIIGILFGTMIALVSESIQTSSDNEKNKMAQIKVAFIRSLLDIIPEKIKNKMNL